MVIALLTAAALAGPLDGGWRCLRAYDLDCAEQIAEAHGGDDPESRYLRGQVYLYRGMPDRAAEALEGVPGEQAQRDRALALRTAEVTAGWVERRQGRYVVRYQPGMDAILAEEALEVLAATDAHVAPLLGGPPPGQTVVELYPSGRAFIAASSLTKEEVETTGTVALSKWSRLLVTSPRALAGGYGWKDTIAHEYLHLLVTHHTHDRTPVWLQEAIARYLDNRWEDGRDHYKLSPRDQGLIARALGSDDLVTFDEMHPSLAKLPSADRAALAYAQVSSLMQYAFERAGEETILRTLPRVDRGDDAREALAAAVGVTDFAELEADWREWLGRQTLDDRGLAALNTVLGGGDAMGLDPALAERVDVQRRVRLGDLLAERGRYDAALVEYRGASSTESPYLRTQLAAALVASGRGAEGAQALEAVVRDYPEYAFAWRALGEARRGLGRRRDAAAAWERALALDPFDLQVREGLVALYGELGQDAARHRAALEQIGRGGR